MRVISLLFFILLTSCAYVVVPEAMGGSRSDGIIELSYEHGSLRRPEVDWLQAENIATQRCRAWGYENATVFGGGISQCSNYGKSGGCLRRRVTIKYQCIGS